MPHIGKDGVLKIDDVAVAQLRSFSVDETGDTVEDTTMTSTFRTYKPTLTSFTGSADVYWDETDSGQNGIVINDEPSIKFFPEGADAGDTYYSGTCIVTGISISASFDGMVEASITFQGKSALTKTTV
jgi:predicted secreted protein